MGNFLFLPRVHITTFVIFNMVPVGPGLGSNYGLRVIHILRALSLSLTSASGRRQSTLCVRGQFITRRERIAWTQTLQLKLPIWSVINVTLSVHKDEYKTVSMRTISVCMNAPCGLTRLRKCRIFFRMQISGSCMWGECCVWSAPRMCFFSHLINQL